MFTSQYSNCSCVFCVCVNFVFDCGFVIFVCVCACMCTHKHVTRRRLPSCNVSFPVLELQLRQLQGDRGDALLRRVWQVRKFLQVASRVHSILRNHHLVHLHIQHACPDWNFTVNRATGFHTFFYFLPFQCDKLVVKDVLESFVPLPRDPRPESLSLVLWWACLNLQWIWACK